MMPDDDPALLRAYQTTGSETAFRALVDRHLSMIYGLALRRTGNRETAEEVTQSVFTTLARKARSGFRARGSLSGWLYKTAFNHSSTALRAEHNRQRAMDRFRMTQTTHNPGETRLDPALRDLLDAAVNHLPAADRSLVIQRYIEGRTYRELGETIGKTEDATRKRVGTAVEKLASYFRSHGHAVPVATLCTALGATVAGPAPVSLAGTVTRTAVESAATQSIASTLFASTAFTVVGAVFAFSVPIALQILAIDSRKQTALAHTAPADSKRTILTVSRVEEALPAASPTIAETLRALASHPNPVHAKAAVSGFLSELSHENLRDALAALPNLPDINARRQIAMALFSRWATFDPREALAVAASVPHPDSRFGAYWGAVESWAMVNPSAAERYLVELTEGGLRTQLNKAFWLGLSKRNPEEAFAKAASIEDPAERFTRLERAFRTWSLTDPKEALAHLRSIEDGARRDRWIEDGIRSYSNTDAESAFKLGLEFVAEGTPVRVLTDVLTNWTAEDPEAAFAAVTALPYGTELNETVSRMAATLNEWSVAQWILTFIPEEHQNTYIIGLTRGADWGNWSSSPDAFAAISELVPTITESTARKRSASRLHRRWKENDPEAAETWFRELQDFSSRH